MNPKLRIEYDLQLAKYCEQAYFSCDGEAAEIEYTVIERDNDIVLALRGTGKDISKPKGKGRLLGLVKDIVTDVRFLPMKHKSGGKYHHPSGFYKAALKVAEAIRKEPLITEVLSLRPITITGHSLGGAVALILAEVLDNISVYQVRQVVTFGAPRVGKLYNPYLFDLRLYRNMNDIVPTLGILPHPTKLIQLGEKKFRLFPSFKYHGILKYKRSLRKLYRSLK